MDESDRLRLLVWGAIGLLVLFAGWRLLGDRGGGGGPVVKVSGPSSPSAAPRRAGTRPPARAYVAVVGAVRVPGLYRVPEGARVAAAVARAGGLAPGADLTGVNIAARVHDGQQIVVPKQGAAAPAAAGAGGGVSAAGPISLSSATVEQLDTLDGIGPGLAKRIVDYRQAHGGFRSVDELGQVEGIGQKRLAALRAAVAP